MIKCKDIKLSCMGSLNMKNCTLLTYKFNAISFKTTGGILLDKLILKCTLKSIMLSLIKAI